MSYLKSLGKRTTGQIGTILSVPAMTALSTTNTYGSIFGVPDGCVSITALVRIVGAAGAAANLVLQLRTVPAEVASTATATDATTFATGCVFDATHATSGHSVILSCAGTVTEDVHATCGEIGSVGVYGFLQNRCVWAAAEGDANAFTGGALSIPEIYFWGVK